VPPDVRNGFAFPDTALFCVFEAMPQLLLRRSLNSLFQRFRKAGGFPHIERQSRKPAIMTFDVSPRYGSGLGLGSPAKYGSTKRRYSKALAMIRPDRISNCDSPGNGSSDFERRYDTLQPGS